MKPDVRNKIILGILLAVALVVVIYQVTKSPGSGSTSSGAAKKPAAAATATAAAKAAAKKSSAASAGAKAGETDPESTFQEVNVDIDTLLKDIEVVNFDYEAEHIDRDPLSPLVGIVRPQTGSGAVVPLSMADVLRKNVTGIIYSKDEPAAVVDDEVVNKGYVYADGTVVHDIEPDRVIFKVGDSLIPVEMKKLGAGQ